MMRIGMPKGLPPGAQQALSIGDPCQVKGYAGPTVMVQCNCEAKTPLLINGTGHVVQCPACKQGLTLLSFELNAQTNNWKIQVVGLIIPKEGDNDAASSKG